MAAPLVAVAGLAWLGGLLGSLITTVVTVFTKRVFWRLAILTAVVSGMALLTGGLMVAGHAAILGLATSMPSGASLGLSLFLPTNVGACVGAMVSARLLRWAYDWQIKFLTMKAAV